MNATLRTLTRRVTIGVAVAGAALLTVAGPASAAPATVSGTPSATQAQAAHKAADTPTVHKLLAGFFADRGKPANQQNAAHRAAVAATMAPKLAGTVPVYYLNPDFVKATSASTSVATLAYMATDAVSSDGQHATVWTVRGKDGAWTEVNIASGSDEVSYTAKAGTHGVVFREPQVNAWYSISDGRVLPLNETARHSVKADGVTIAQYQKLVHSRYANKMAGSAYAKKHTLGGNWLDKAAPAAQHDSSSYPIGFLAAGIALAGAALVVAWRRYGHRLVARR
ncbi:MAG: hypothetical protein WCA46_16350 [Actinocatenispora sp.]